MCGIAEHRTTDNILKTVDKDSAAICRKVKLLYKHIHCSKSMCYTSYDVLASVIGLCAVNGDIPIQAPLLVWVCSKQLQNELWTWTTAQQRTDKPTAIKTQYQQNQQSNTKSIKCQNNLPDLHPIMVPVFNTAIIFSRQLKTIAKQNLHNWECNTICINLTKRWLWLFSHIKDTPLIIAINKIAIWFLQA